MHHLALRESHSFARRLALCGVATIVATALLPTAPAAAVDNVPVTVQLSRFDILQDPDPAAGQGQGDFYAQISFADGTSTTTSEVTNNSPFTPPADWALTTTVDRDAQATLAATVRIFDADSGVAAPDDEVDLDPDDNDLALDFTIDLTSGGFSGSDITANHGRVIGDGDTEHAGVFEGGEAGDLSFSVGLGPSTDIDGDGIPSDIERFGIRNPDGSIHTDMAALGADPCRKTIAVEVDYLQAPDHDHEPDPAALAEVVAAFDSAPLAAASPCPYGGGGSDGGNFIFDVDDAIPLSADDEDDPFDLNDLQTQRATSFDTQRDPYFFYNVWAHTHNGDSSSGVCCQAKGFLVTLGFWSGGNGTVRDQSGTLMHELGHNLGLGHGGGDGNNYKPNYLSVMNYRYQVSGLVDFDAWLAAGGAASSYVPNAAIDYSRQELDPLNETALSEPAGIGGPNTAVFWSDPSNTVRLSDARLPVDWNFDSDTTDSGITVDLNDDICIDSGDDGTLDTTAADDDAAGGSVIRTGLDRQCDSTAAGDDGQRMTVSATQPAELDGFDDWSNIAFAGQINAGLGGNTGPLDVKEVTFEEAEQIKADLVVAANEAPTADAGDDVSLPEGGSVMLDGTGSSDTDGDELTYQWEPVDHLDDPTSPTPLYTAVDDTVEVLTLTVTDPLGLSDSDTVTVAVTNVAPDVTASGDTLDEGGTAQISAIFTDPGVLDTHTATVDWGDGTSEAVAVNQDAGSGSLAASHTYGDDGSFTVTVTVVDDDDATGVDGTGQDAVTAAVGNLNPDLALDTDESVTFPGGAAFVTQQGAATSHSADASDAGSDDLTFTWGFGPATTYYNDGAAEDPDPSPFGTFPFFATDTAIAPALDIGVDTVDVTATDDDAGSDQQSLARIVTGVAQRTEGSGWWRHQYNGRGDRQLDADVLEGYLEIVRFASGVFGEDVPLDTLADAAAVLSPTGTDHRDLATAELLVAWLHFASGAVPHDASVPLGGRSSSPYLTVMGDVEQVVADPEATRRELIDAAQDAHATRHAS